MSELFAKIRNVAGTSTIKVTLCLIMLLVALAAFTQISVLILSKYDVHSKHQDLHLELEKQQSLVAQSIECAPESDRDFSRARACVLMKINRPQNPASMLALGLIAEALLQINPDDIQLRIGTILAISKTVHAYRSLGMDHEKSMAWYTTLCKQALLGWVVRCQDYHHEEDAHSRVGALLETRYRLSRGSLPGHNM